MHGGMSKEIAAEVNKAWFEVENRDCRKPKFEDTYKVVKEPISVKAIHHLLNYSDAHTMRHTDGKLLFRDMIALLNRAKDDSITVVLTRAPYKEGRPHEPTVASHDCQWSRRVPSGALAHELGMKTKRTEMAKSAFA